MDTSLMKATDIVKFTPTNYAQLASHARGLIVKDMNNGVLQNGIKEYKKDDNGVSKYAERKATGKLGKYRKADKVTMLLSGETANRIRPEGKRNSAKLIFERGNIVRWNENNNDYVIADLNAKNRTSSTLFFQKIVDRNINKYNNSKPIIIKIGK